MQRINYLKAAEREAQGPLGSLPAGVAVDVGTVVPKITP